MRKIIALVFAGGCAKEMSVLTLKRPTAAVVFGGSYRMIDFALTSLSNTAEIQHVGVITQYRPSSLVQHIGNGLAWDFIGTNRNISILSPYLVSEANHWYKGTADALYQNIDFLDLYKPDDVLIVSGDHVYSMDCEKLINYHIEKAADVTLAFSPVERNPSRFGIAEFNSEGRIINYEEKPQYPRSNNASMTVYIFKREILVEELKKYIAGGQKQRSYHIYDDILPVIIKKRRVFGWIHYGIWEYTRTLDDYFSVHQKMLGEEPEINLSELNIRTNMIAQKAVLPPPAKFYSTSHVVNSYISGGCHIEGIVENSILSPNVCVKKDAVVRNSILWNDVVVNEKAVLDKVICDKRCIIGEKAKIGYGDEIIPNEEQPASLQSGITVFGMNVNIPAGYTAGRNIIIYPGISPDKYKNKYIESGKTIK